MMKWEVRKNMSLEKIYCNDVHSYKGIGKFGRELVTMDPCKFKVFCEDLEDMDTGIADLYEVATGWEVPIIVLKYFQKLEILNETLNMIIFG